jgi:transcriptional regulator with XRE-family HTH domain
MDKLTKQDSMLWINHAIARFNGLGKRQKELAEALGIEETRLSEMKQGKGLITPSIIDRIVDFCGAPKRGKGRFENAEIYNSLNEFFDQYDSVSTNRFYHNLVKAFSRKDYTDIILNNCNLASNEIDSEDDKSRRITTVNLLNEILHSPEFNNICLSYQKTLISSEGQFKWENKIIQRYSGDIFQIRNLIISEKKVFHALYLQWLVIQKYNEYNFPLKEQLITEPLPDSIPVVITGECILVLSNDDLGISSPINKFSVNHFGVVDNYLELPNGYSSTYINDDHTVSVLPDYWKDIRCELYLGEAMNYHLIIQLSKKEIFFYGDELSGLNEASELYVDKDDRIAVIANINPLDLLNNMEELRKWCGLGTDNNYKVKKNIAKAGGYVPGARVLV